MMNKLVIIFLLLCLSISSYAQRASTGQSSLGAGFAFIDGFHLEKKSSSYAIQLNYSLYRRTGTIDVDLIYLRNTDTYSSYIIPVENYLLAAGYKWRIFQTYTRKFILSAGMSAIFGYEIANQSDNKLAEGIYISSKNKIAWGIMPGFRMEYFACKRLAIFTSLQETLNFNSDMTINHTLFSVGLKYLIN